MLAACGVALLGAPASAAMYDDESVPWRAGVPAAAVARGDDLRRAIAQLLSPHGVAVDYGGGVAGAVAVAPGGSSAEDAFERLIAAHNLAYEYDPDQRRVTIHQDVTLETPSDHDGVSPWVSAPDKRAPATAVAYQYPPNEPGGPTYGQDISRREPERLTGRYLASWTASGGGVLSRERTDAPAREPVRAAAPRLRQSFGAVAVKLGPPPRSAGSGLVELRGGLAGRSGRMARLPPG